MLYIANISPSPSKNEIRKFFEKFAEIRTLIWITRKFAGYFIGQILIEFVNDADNERALTELNGTVFCGKKLRVRPARRWKVDEKAKI